MAMGKDKIRESDVVEGRGNPEGAGDDTMFKISKSIRAVNGVAGGVLLDWNSGQMFSVNAMGGRILALTGSGIDEPGLIDVLCKEYRIEPGVARGDLRAFLTELHRLGLVE